MGVIDNTNRVMSEFEAIGTTTNTNYISRGLVNDIKVNKAGCADLNTFKDLAILAPIGSIVPQLIALNTLCT